MPKRRVSVLISLSDPQLQQLAEVARTIEANFGDLAFRDYGRIWGFKYADPVQFDDDLVLRSKDGAFVTVQFKGYAPKVQVMTAPPPPRGAKLLLRYVLPRKHQDHIIGDLEEAYYTEWLLEHDPGEARRLYWWHAIRSIAPMLWVGVKRSGIIAAIVGAADWLRDRLS